MISSCDLRVSQELVCLIGFPFTAGSALIRDWVMSEPVCNLAGFVMTTLGIFYPSLTVIRSDVLKKFSSEPTFTESTFPKLTCLAVTQDLRFIVSRF